MDKNEAMDKFNSVLSNANDDEQEDDLEEGVVDENDSGSDVGDKIEDGIDSAKNKMDSARKGENKTDTPDGPDTGTEGKNGNNNSNSQNGDANNPQSGNGTQQGGNGAQQGGSGQSMGNSSASGASNGTGAANASATGGAGGTSAGGSAAASGSAAGGGATAGGSAAASGGAASGAAASGAAAGGAAAGGTAAGGAAATAATAATPVGWIILIIIAVVLIVMMVIGFLSFFIDGIGLISEMFLKLANGLWTNLSSFFVGRDEATVKSENLVDVANYLEEMGYELEDYGFLDTNGKGTTIEDSSFNDEGKGTRKYKNSDGKVVLEREITQNEDGSITEGEIKKVASTCIWSYLVAENRTYLITNDNWNFADFFAYVFGDAKKAGAGMITLEGNKGKVSINREAKTMEIILNNYKYQYDLDGWTGKYGKSLEFLLTLHLATMSPDFAKEVALESDFNTIVTIGLEKVSATIQLMVENENGNYNIITESNYSDLGFSDEEWEAIEEYNKGEIVTYTPYIKKVENHWYRDLNFDGCYEKLENDPTTSEDDDQFTTVYEYVGLGEDDDILAGKNLYVLEMRQEDIYQVKEPEVIDNSSKIKAILLGIDKDGNENANEDYKFYIYNGIPLQEDEEREKKYIIQKVGTGEDAQYIMNTKPFEYAFAILESVHTQDAEFVLRDLKELFYELGIDVEGSSEDDVEIEPLKWIIPDYIPVVWDPMSNSQETKMTINAETQGKSGFMEDFDIVMPAKGKIVKISDELNSKGDVESQTVKITFTEGDVEGMSLFLTGVMVNSDISVGDILDAEEEFAKTTKKDITVIMTDKNKSPLTNVDDYICPPERSQT